jgi:hypothetical protein
MSTGNKLTSMVPVFNGPVCIGFVLARGRTGFESFDGDGNTVGMFAGQREAVAAISTAKERT